MHLMQKIVEKKNSIEQKIREQHQACLTQLMERRVRDEAGAQQELSDYSLIIVDQIRFATNFYDEAQLALIRIDLNEVLFRFKCRAEQETWWQRWFLRSKVKQQFTDYERKQDLVLKIQPNSKQFDGLKSILDESANALFLLNQDRNLHAVISSHLASLSSASVDAGSNLSRTSETRSMMLHDDRVLYDRLTRLEAVIDAKELELMPVDLPQPLGSREPSMCTVMMDEPLIESSNLKASVRTALAHLYGFKSFSDINNDEFKIDLLIHVKRQARWSFFGPSEYQTVEHLLNSADELSHKIDYIAVERRLERLVKFRRMNLTSANFFCVSDLRRAFGVARGQYYNVKICKQIFEPIELPIVSVEALLPICSTETELDDEGPIPNITDLLNAGELGGPLIINQGRPDNSSLNPMVVGSPPKVIAGTPPIKSAPWGSFFHATSVIPDQFVVLSEVTKLANEILVKNVTDCARAQVREISIDVGRAYAAAHYQDALRINYSETHKIALILYCLVFWCLSAYPAVGKKQLDNLKIQLHNFLSGGWRNVNSVLTLTIQDRVEGFPEATYNALVNIIGRQLNQDNPEVIHVGTKKL